MTAPKKAKTPIRLKFKKDVVIGMGKDGEDIVLFKKGDEVEAEPPTYKYRGWLVKNPLYRFSPDERIPVFHFEAMEVLI